MPMLSGSVWASWHRAQRGGAFLAALPFGLEMSSDGRGVVVTLDHDAGDDAVAQAARVVADLIRRADVRVVVEGRSRSSDLELPTEGVR